MTDTAAEFDAPVALAAQHDLEDFNSGEAALDDWLRRRALANMAKLLASEATWHAADATFQTYGGFAFAKEYDIERKWREVRIYQTAPISTNLILAYIGQHVLGMPRSY